MATLAERHRVVDARDAVLATLTEDGAPAVSLVPFVIDGDRWWAVLHGTAEVFDEGDLTYHHAVALSALRLKYPAVGAPAMLVRITISRWEPERDWNTTRA